MIKLSISVVFLFVWSFNVDSDVIGLVCFKDSQLGTEMSQVKSGNLLVQNSWKLVHSNFILVC